MKMLRLVLSLVFMVPAWTLLGAFSTLDSGLPLWWGLAGGGAIGVFFGLVFGGNRKWRIWDYVFGPQEPEDDEEKPGSTEAGALRHPQEQE